MCVYLICGNCFGRGLTGNGFTMNHFPIVKISRQLLKRLKQINTVASLANKNRITRRYSRSQPAGLLRLVSMRKHGYYFPFAYGISSHSFHKSNCGGLSHGYPIKNEQCSQIRASTSTRLFEIRRHYPVVHYPRLLNNTQTEWGLNGKSLQKTLDWHSVLKEPAQAESSNHEPLTHLRDKRRGTISN